MTTSTHSFDVPAIRSRVFGYLPSGEPVQEYTLTNHQGHSVAISDFGGTITRILVPNKHGELGDVALGFDQLEPYLGDVGYMGAIIGRVGNRIANARFTLNETTYTLQANNGPNNLHGGPEGFDKRLWQVEPYSDAAGPALRLRLASADGDQGFPGNLQVEVCYVWTHNSELVVDFRATTDKATPVNLTQHSYFNLAGQGDVLGHRVQIFADHITDVNEVQVPLGSYAPVAGTPFDFRSPHSIGERIEVADEQLAHGAGYDHNFVINQAEYKALTLAARVDEAGSGRRLEVFTQEPGVQFYTGNFLDGRHASRGQTYSRRSGFCLEPQHHPDAINQAAFPSVVLLPDDVYSSQTRFKFSLSE